MQNSERPFFLKPLSPTVATTYLVTRIIALLLLLPLSQEFLRVGSPADSWFGTLANTLKQAKILGISQVSLPFLGLGGCVFTGMLFRTRLVPVAISLTGGLGYTLVLLGGIAGWFGVLDTSPFGPATFLALPVAVFEILLLPFWLFFKGFDTSRFANHPGDSQ